MKKLLLYLTLFSLVSGCVSVSKTDTQDRKPVEAESVGDAGETLDLGEVLPELENIRTEQLEEYAEKKGVIFAKTKFLGVLETRYVKLLFEDLDDPAHKFQLHIGDSSGQQTFPWEVKSVQQGYFFVELPVGRYSISSVTIPVGSTTATEKMNVHLEVLPGTICYVGTLKLVGTKEKIKLGGVPVIKPGFEFTVEVLDEHEEGIAAFKKNYPEFPHPITVKLMEIRGVVPE